MGAFRIHAFRIHAFRIHALHLQTPLSDCDLNKTVCNIGYSAKSL